MPQTLMPGSGSPNRAISDVWCFLGVLQRFFVLKSWKHFVNLCLNMSQCQSSVKDIFHNPIVLGSVPVLLHKAAIGDGEQRSDPTYVLLAKVSVY
jgi:hypothetical protein